MAFELPALPYAQDALEPHITANTLSFHHGKHHNTYVTNLNNMVADSDLADKSLEEIITTVPVTLRPVFQQCCTGLEPHILLAFHVTKWWWCTNRRHC